jgi:UDP-N-acetylmuramoyl-tripeptide--D-alanyl-D-alanine ligase
VQQPSSSATPVSGLPCAVIEVPDTLLALQNLARRYRAVASAMGCRLTGSNGKTSTKDLTAAILSRQHSLSRHERQPQQPHRCAHLPCSRSLRSTTCAITEMGMNHAGEIKTLVDIALPDAAILTNVGTAHIEHLGSPRQHRLGKSLPAYQHPRDGTVILNADDDYTDRISLPLPRPRAHRRYRQW